MNFSQGWIVLVFLGISAISWVFGKMKEKAEAEEAQKRARLHQERLARMGEAGTESPPPGPAPAANSKQQQLLARKQQLAQLRQERLAALRAEMAARQQKAASTRARTPQSAPQSRRPQPQQRSVQQRPAPQQRAAAPAPQAAKSRTISRPANKPMPSATSRSRQQGKPSGGATRSGLGTRTAHPQQGTDHETVHRLVADAESTSVTRRTDHSRIVGGYTREDWRKAIVMSELLAPPVSLRQEH